MKNSSDNKSGLVIYNSDKKPNAVQAIIQEIRNLQSIGYTGKEIDYNFNGCDWTGYEFTSVNITGTHIKDLSVCN